MSKISELSDGGVIQGGDTLIAVRSGGNVKVTYGGSTTANIDGGTIDGTVIGGTTPAAGSFTTGSFTGNVSFGDNDKAIFGAGSDLQIYHSGTNSFIQEQGTGDLYITTNGSKIDMMTNGLSEYGVRIFQDGEVSLYHNGSAKLATTSTGIDVTGTIVGDGLIVDSSSPVIELAAGNNNDSRIVFSEAAADIYSIEVNGTSGSLQDFTIYHDLTSATTARFQINQNGDISFYDTAGTTAKVFWDASTEELQISSSQAVTLGSSGGTGTLPYVGFGTYWDGTKLRAQAQSYFGYALVTDRPNNTVSLQRYDSSGPVSGNITLNGSNVGIGNSSPLGRLTISNAAGTNAPTTVTAANTYLQLGSDDYGPSNNGKFMIGFGYTDAINTNSPAYIGYEEVSTSGDTYGDLTFYTRSVNTDTAPAERMRIDSSGNLLVGTTDTTAFDGTTGINIGGNRNALAFSATGHNQMLIYSKTTGLQFYDATNNADRMLLDNSGNLLIGKGTAADTTEGQKLTNTQMVQGKNGTSAHDFHDFYRGTAGSLVRVGNIRTTGTSTAYNTSSDHRLKENVVAMTGATARLKQLTPKRFNFIADSDTTVDGFLAHEVQTVVPEAVTGTHNEVDDDGNAVYQGIDQSKLVPLLVATIQELEARIAALESN